MKNKLLLLLACSSLLLAACKSTVQLQVMRPADVAMPEHVMRFILADRTRPTEDKKGLNIAEGILTGEGIGLDKEGSIACLESVKATLMQTPRFSVDITSVTGLKGTGTAKIPPALPWDTVIKICTARNADALVVLESFDSNNQTFTESVPRPNAPPEIRTRTRVTILTSWRVYDPKNRRIYDEHFQTSEYIYNGAIGGLLDLAIQRQRKKEMMRAAGAQAGDIYGHRISPQWVWVGREYYAKGSEQMKQAARYVRTQNWDKAAELWRTQLNSPREKTAGRAHHNMALYAERNGELDVAISWTDKAYTQYGNKTALRYRDQLYWRKQDEQRLKEQMKALESKSDSTGTGK